MRRSLPVALALVVLTSAPSGAGWAVGRTAPTTAATKQLAPVPRPSATASCVTDGSFTVTVSWTHVEPDRTGYELWRVVDGMPSKVTDAGPAVTSAQDVASVALSLSYYVITRSASWTAQSLSREVPNPLACAGTPTI